MGFDYENAERFSALVNEADSLIVKNSELITAQFRHSADRIKAEFEKATTTAQDESRKLCIGIIGAVKAGKSSFLNALFFDGKDVLPKACTPMTAALTKITYSETPGAVIHFYTQEDWRFITERAAEYDELLEINYRRYCEDIEKENESKLKNIANAATGKPKKVAMPKQEFKKLFNNEAPEDLLGCKELVTMAKAQGNITDKLGTVEEVSGTTTEDLADYVGADGKYTAIVNYVELKINMPELEGLEIVDTPGLNDPVVSRGEVTKKFLSQCDVALLLSPCSQFMPSNTVTLMTEMLPSASVKNFIVIGSKLDSGLLDYHKSNSIEQAYRSSISGYKRSFENTLNQLREQHPENRFINDIAAAQVLFVSSMMFAVSKKRESGEMLDKEEAKVISQLSRFENFQSNDAAFLNNLSNIDSVLAALDKILDQKEEIFKRSNDELIGDYSLKLAKAMDDIISDCEAKRRQLEQHDSESLKARYDHMISTIDYTRSRLNSAFEISASETRTSAYAIGNKMIAEASGYSTSIPMQHKKKDHTHIEKHGLFNMQRTIYTTTDDWYEADSSEGSNRVLKFAGRCHEIIADEYPQIFNKAGLEKSIKEITLQAFNEKDEFSEMEILSRLQAVMSSLSVPTIMLDPNEYEDKVRSRFKGTVIGNEIKDLNQLVQSLISNLATDMRDRVLANAEEIAQSLEHQAVEFADGIEKSFSEDLEMLLAQLANKEESLKKNKELITALKELKAKIIM